MPQDKPDLLRAIGRWSLAALMVNIVIGGGIFGLPSTVAGILGGQSPIAYLIAGAGIGAIAACVAEVASRFEKAGGAYLYSRAAFGRFWGLQTGWLLWLTRVSAAAAVANVFIDYLAGFWPQAKGPAMRFVILILLIGGLAAANIRGVKTGTWFSTSFTLAKLLPLLLLISGGFFFICVHGSPVPPVAETHPAGAWMRAVLLLIFAYGGFDSALIPASEIKNPARDAPVALLAALLTVTIVYCLVQFVVIRMLPNSALTSRPLSATALVFGGDRMATIISVGALLATFGHLSANMIASPRITFALAEQGDFPRWFGAIHRRYQTPHLSIVAFAVLLWGLALLGTFRWNAALSSSSRLVVYGTTCAALPVLRKKYPGKEGFHLPGGLAFTGIGIAFALVLLSRVGVAEIIALVITATITLLNWLAVRDRKPSTNI